MQFKSARAIEQLVWNMRLADYPRSLDRARIDSLANGSPPYPLDEAEKAVFNVSERRLACQSKSGHLHLPRDRGLGYTTWLLKCGLSATETNSESGYTS